MLSLTMHETPFSPPDGKPGQCWSSATTTPVARPWNLRSARKTPGRIDTSTVVNVAACYPPTMQSAALPTASGLCNERRRRNSAVSGLRSSTNPRVSFPFYHPTTPLQTPFVPIPYHDCSCLLLFTVLPPVKHRRVQSYSHRETDSHPPTPPSPPSPPPPPPPSPLSPALPPSIFTATNGNVVV